MKYANNSFEGMVNCTSHIVNVKGRRHIVLYAKRRIEPGEEILFDYGYSLEKRKAIDWLRSFAQKYFFQDSDETPQKPERQSLQLKRQSARKTIKQ